MEIKGDTGKPWRMNKLVEYILSFPDELSPVVNDFFEKEKANFDDKVWWVLLYSSCYCVPTACAMYKNLDYRTLNSRKLKEFWKNNKSKLIFQSDRRYIKNMNQFCDIVSEFMYKCKRKPWKYLKKYISDNSKETYTKMYKEVSSWKYYGRFGTILFMYNINKLLKIPMESDFYDWKHGSTTTEAIFNAKYKDEKADGFKKDPKLSKQEIQKLDNTLKQIIDRLKSKASDKNWTVLNVTSDMCSYRKLYKASRYLGYYVDRQQEEILTLQKNYPEYADMWKSMWESRKNNLPKEFLGELNGYVGIQKNRMTSWVERGEFR